jgi:hypothetical protein
MAKTIKVINTTKARHISQRELNATSKGEIFHVFKNHEIMKCATGASPHESRKEFVSASL